MLYWQRFSDIIFWILIWRFRNRPEKLLHELITEHGDEGFLEIENRVNAGLAVDKTVIATGGSAVFGEDAMKHLQEISTVVYLRLPYKKLKKETW